MERTPFIVMCNHCENPPCVRACPTNATFKRESDGIVLMDFHRCIGCRFCMAACPFGARSFNYRDPRPFIKEVNTKFPTRMKGVVEKCNFCAERLAEGLLPAAAKIGQGAERYTVHAKGQAQPMHEPRLKRGLAIGYAMSPTGVRKAR